MIFINGFFLVNFIPFGILVLAGIILFFSRKFKNEKWHYPLLFIITVIVFISLLRISVIIDRRYAMPVIVPGIVISVFAIMLLPGILRRFKIKYADAIVRLAVAITLLTCTAKAMRFQESKPYLYKLSEAIQNDCDKNNVNKAVILIFGNPGGKLDFSPKIDVIKVKSLRARDRFINIEHQLATLGPEYLKISYQMVYLLCVGPESGNFAADWDNKYHDKPELVYEYIRTKDQTALRLYRLNSTYPSAWLSPDKLEKILVNYNILKNGDFKKQYRIPREDSSADVLESSGVSPSEDGNIYFPEGWMIDPGHGWTSSCIPVSIKMPGNLTDALNIQSKDWISIYTEDAFDGGKAYLVAVQARAGQQGGKLTLWAYVYTADMNYVRTVSYRDIKLSRQNSRELIPFRLDNCEKFRLVLLASGDVSIKNIMAVPAEMPAK